MSDRSSWTVGASPFHGASTFPEPPGTSLLGLSEMPQVLLSCLYTRHHNGFVRHRHVGLLLSSTETGIAPFILALLGEYVVEIARFIDEKKTTLTKANCVRFAVGNSEFCALTSRRAVSYWKGCHRTEFPRRAVIILPAHALLTLGLWPRNETRLLFGPTEGVVGDRQGRAERSEKLQAISLPIDVRHRNTSRLCNRF
jgi:hypothetical protein